MANRKADRERRRNFLIENHERVVDMNSLFELVEEMFERGLYSKFTVTGDAVSHTLRGIYHIREGRPDAYGLGMRDYRPYSAFHDTLFKNDHLSEQSMTVEYGRWKKIHGK